MPSKTIAKKATIATSKKALAKKSKLYQDILHQGDWRVEQPKSGAATTQILENLLVQTLSQEENHTLTAAQAGDQLQKLVKTQGLRDIDGRLLSTSRFCKAHFGSFLAFARSLPHRVRVESGNLVLLSGDCIPIPAHEERQQRKTTANANDVLHKLTLASII